MLHIRSLDRKKSTGNEMNAKHRTILEIKHAFYGSQCIHKLTNKNLDHASCHVIIFAQPFFFTHVVFRNERKLSGNL